MGEVEWLTLPTPTDAEGDTLTYELDFDNYATGVMPDFVLQTYLNYIRFGPTDSAHAGIYTFSMTATDDNGYGPLDCTYTHTLTVYIGNDCPEFLESYDG